MLSIFFYRRIYSTPHFIIRIILAYREIFFVFNGQSGNLFFKNLTCQPRKRLVRVPSLALSIRTCDLFTVGTLKYRAQRPVVITETQIIHVKTLISGINAVSHNSEFKYLLLVFYGSIHNAPPISIFLFLL